MNLSKGVLMSVGGGFLVYFIVVSMSLLTNHPVAHPLSLGFIGMAVGLIVYLIMSIHNKRVLAMKQAAEGNSKSTKPTKPQMIDLRDHQY